MKAYSQFTLLDTQKRGPCTKKLQASSVIRALNVPEDSRLEDLYIDESGKVIVVANAPRADLDVETENDKSEDDDEPVVVIDEPVIDHPDLNMVITSTHAAVVATQSGQVMVSMRSGENCSTPTGSSAGAAIDNCVDTLLLCVNGDLTASSTADLSFETRGDAVAHSTQSNSGVDDTESVFL